MSCFPSKVRLIDYPSFNIWIPTTSNKIPQTQEETAKEEWLEFCNFYVTFRSNTISGGSGWTSAMVDTVDHWRLNFALQKISTARRQISWWMQQISMGRYLTWAYLGYARRWRAHGGNSFFIQEWKKLILVWNCSAKKNHPPSKSEPPTQ